MKHSIDCPVSAAMDLAFHSASYPPSLSPTSTARRPNFNVSNKTFTVRNFSLPSALAYDSELESKKHLLLSSVQDTQRGLLTTPDQRSSIEEALVNVEGRNMGHPINLAKLDGTWRLQYTSAPDVLILLQAAATLPFFQVGQIFQKFECRDQSNGGIIRNVVRWSIPNLLEITVQDINISEELQALIAPAILPRSFISLQILQFLRTFKAQIPVRDPGRESVGGLYYLSYLDDNMLLGRAVGGGGVFVFTRAQSLY
ncbi:probable plastid-lipid-associated protein 10, chloroplastic isoform X3 [Vigna unguiculata]|uniref:probable plastid-lipid-associated protein 10, chloroplastic isoform X3 n=1 Tax=Vigna unguiculata TaxID=3917 RepID=UPI0010160DDB|nr:probable plastid-lipid-associated protein 10, chloroplastic isoform X3 [Vigna unguiculata]